jgi:hypothetical protein
MMQNQSADDMLATLLRDNLPPERDPLFRVNVLIRCEQRRFRRQLVTAVTSGPVLTVRGLLSPLLSLITRTVARAFLD